MWVALFVHWPRLDAVQEHVDRMTFPAWLQQVWLWVEWCMESMPFFPDRTGSNYLDKQTYSSLRFDHDGSFIAVNGHNSIIPPGGFEWFKGIVFLHAILLMDFGRSVATWSSYCESSHFSHTIIALGSIPSLWYFNTTLHMTRSYFYVFLLRIHMNCS